MASTFSPLKIELITTGEQSGTWGVTTNTNLGTALEEAITGTVDVSFSSGNVTLTLTDTNATQTARNLRLNCTGATADRTLTVPAIEKQYIINNATSYVITVGNASGTTTAVPAGKTMIVFNNGTNVVDVLNTFTSAILGAVNAGSIIPFYFANQAAFPSASTYHGAVAHSHADGAMYFAHSSAWVRLLDTGGPLGTPSSGTLTNATGLPLTTGVTGTLPIANGGTNSTTTPIAGAVPYGTGTAYAFTAAGTSGYLLTSAGAGVPTWTATTGSGNVVLATSPTLVTPVLGTPSSGTLSGCTVDGTDGVGFRNVPINSQSAAYTTVLADSGKAILHPSTDANARTFTIDSNATVAYALGTVLTFINMTSQVVTIAITSDTLYLAGTGTTGSRSLAQYGMASAIKMTSTTWIISGNGVT